jgi:transaldolase
MALLTYPYNIRNATVSAALALNSNFTAISAIVNGGIGEEHVSRLAALVGATVTAARVITNTIDPATKLVIKLPSTDGSHSVRFKDYQGNTVLEVKSDGEVVI